MKSYLVEYLVERSVNDCRSQWLPHWCGGWLKTGRLVVFNLSKLRPRGSGRMFSEGTREGQPLV